MVVHLSDAHYITDAAKFISVTLLALRAMMQMELPHINVLSKIDLLSTYGELRASELLKRQPHTQRLICDTTPTRRT